MKIFEIQTGLTSYVYSVIKIIICIALILLCVCRNYFVTYSVSWLKIAVSVVCFAVTMLCIICTYMSIAELFYTYENRCHPAINDNSAVAYSVDCLVKYIISQDVSEVAISTASGIIMIGSSSENDYDSALFFDKRYYVGTNEFTDINQFVEAINFYASNNELFVSSVEGLPPEYINLVN